MEKKYLLPFILITSLFALWDFANDITNPMGSLLGMIIVSRVVLALLESDLRNNVLCLPTRFLSEKDANQIALVFLQTGPEGGRHQKRLEKITSCWT